jgi:hypothetical protein
MNKTIKESIGLIVAILLVLATIAINFVAVVEYDILEYKYETLKTQYEIELEQRDYEIQVLKEHNNYLETLVKEKTCEKE